MTSKTSQVHFDVTNSKTSVPSVPMVDLDFLSHYHRYNVLGLTKFNCHLTVMELDGTRKLQFGVTDSRGYKYPVDPTFQILPQTSPSAPPRCRALVPRTLHPHCTSSHRRRESHLPMSPLRDLHQVRISFPPSLRSQIQIL